jgi:TRAP transporter TAXI family solute receptor
MPRVVRVALLSMRDLALTAGPFVLIAAVLLAAAFYFLKPNPPRHVVFATGPESGAYARFAALYAEELKKHRIQVALRATEGSRENLRLLHDPKESVDFAFVQGGSSESARAQEEQEKGLPLVSLGTVFYEPVWLFYRAQAAKGLNRQGMLENLTQMKGWRVSVGARGSGIPGVTSRLLAANLMERDDIRRQNLEPTPAVVALIGGELDAAFLVTAPETQLVQMLLQTPGIQLYEFLQGEALARRYKFLTPVVLPRGVADLSRNIPARDLELVATTTSLVAREDTHPALLQLFVQAAGRIHGGAGWIARAGQFPSASGSELPLAPEAERYYRNGPPLMQRYLPFWLANLIDRMWVSLIAIGAILIPISRMVPPLYAFRVRSRIFRWYRQLRQIEDSVARNTAARADLLQKLEELDAKAERVAVPLAYTDELYDLRSHIALVRDRLQSR